MGRLCKTFSDRYSKLNVKMTIGGFIKQSLIDYPGNIASVIFTKGCNFRCGFCHNPDLVLPELIRKSPTMPVEDVYAYIEKNRGLLDAVVITGGEPSLHNTLPQFINKIKQYDLKVKLDTNGSNPKMLSRIISSNLVDYIAMDVKTAINSEKYSEITGIDIDNDNEMIRNLELSMQLIIESGVQHEFRTTHIKKFHKESDIISIAKRLAKAQKLCFQAFRPNTTIDNDLSNQVAYSDNELKSIINKIDKKPQKIEFR